MYEFFSVSSVFRWQDVVDILLNSYILFRLYVLFRGTNVLRVIAGIALLWVFQRAAVSVGLIVTSWAMQGIIAGAALIIIIVFRNEIRNVLQAPNLKAILWGVPQKSVIAPVDSIIEGVYELAKNKVGALIVLPGNEGLKDHIQEGVWWDGKITREMLMSIFWPDNPVHDGAAIIKGDRVTQVGTILPLSERVDLPSYYGTRHRAAAGLAEKSDAMVIVVSEERGEVMVAMGDQLLEIKDNIDLKTLIDEHLDISPPHDGPAKKENPEFLIAGLICVVCVCAVWFSFSRGLEALVTMDIPVEYMNRSSTMEIFDTSVNNVRLHLSGSGALIKNIHQDQIKFRLDLKDAVVGINRFAVTQENVSLPPGIFLRKMEPLVIEVILDVPVVKELPIQVDWIGKMGKSLILEDVELSPNSAKVVGGSRVLEGVTTLYTEKILLDTLTKTGQTVVNLALYPANLKLASGSSNTVVIKYKVKNRS
ncbi:MAG: DisA protein [Desulfobacteraceae bacterium]|nr:DisA protein [Desulfobacteraceae bacterium]